jgi:site-specific recombinase XerD
MTPPTSPPDPLTALATVDVIPPSAIDLAVAAWLDAKGRRSHKTHVAYSSTIAQFRAALRAQGLDLDTLARDDGYGRNQRRDITLIAQAFASFSARGKAITPATFNQRLAVLSSFYDYAKAYDFLDHNPIDAIDRQKVQPYAKARALPPASTNTALKGIDRATLLGARDYALLAVFLQTGRRLSEVASLRWENITILDDLVTLTFEHCKGNKIMIDTLARPTGRALLSYLHRHYGPELGRLDGAAPIWVNLSPDPALSGQAIGIQAIADVCQKYFGTSKVHTTRHTFSHNMQHIGASTRTIKEKLGHEAEATTELYLEQLVRADNPYADQLAALTGID